MMTMLNNQEFNQAAGIQPGQLARSEYDRVWITPAGYEAFNPAVARPVYLWTVIAVEARYGANLAVLEEVDSTTTFSQAIEISQALNELERARGLQRRYCVRRSGASAPEPVEVVEVDLPF